MHLMTTKAPDAIGSIMLVPPEQGGRRKDAHDGYRPHLVVRPGLVTSADLRFPLRGVAKPGESVEVHLRFFFPEAAEGSLWAGKRVRVHEGDHQVGEIVVEQVPNTLLDVEQARGPVPHEAESEAWTWTQWHGATGGYGTPYDPRPVLRLLRKSPRSQALWDDLWSGLHHQGDIGSASVLAVPLLAWVHAHSPVPDWNALALFCTIEGARRRTPDVWPSNLHFSRYTNAVASMAQFALARLALDDEPSFVAAALATIAYDRGLPHHAGLLAELRGDEAEELLRQLRGC